LVTKLVFEINYPGFDYQNGLVSELVSN